MWFVLYQTNHQGSKPLLKAFHKICSVFFILQINLLQEFFNMILPVPWSQIIKELPERIIRFSNFASINDGLKILIRYSYIIKLHSQKSILIITVIKKSILLFALSSIDRKSTRLNSSHATI